MIKHTHAYRAALVLLADALARQDPAAVIAEIKAGGVISDLTNVMQKRHPEFAAAMHAKVARSMNGPKAASRPALRSAAPRRNGVGLRRYEGHGSIIMTYNKIRPTGRIPIIAQVRHFKSDARAACC